MRDHRRRRGILDLGVGDDADRQTEPPLRQAGDGFDPGVIERACGAVRIDAHRVDGGLVAGGVGAGRIRRIGDDRIGAGGGHQRHLRHVVDGELAAALALRDPLGKDARGDPVGGRQPVADKQDHVLRLARTGVVDRPHHTAAARAVADLDRDTAGPGQCDIAQDQRRLVLVVFAIDEASTLAEGGGIVRPVDRHFQFRRVDAIRKLDLEVELGAGKDFGAVDRIDRLSRCGRTRQQDGNSGCGECLDHDRCPAIVGGAANGWIPRRAARQPSRAQ